MDICKSSLRAYASSRYLALLLLVQAARSCQTNADAGDLVPTVTLHANLAENNKYKTNERIAHNIRFDAIQLDALDPDLAFFLSLSQGLISSTALFSERYALVDAYSQTDWTEVKEPQQLGSPRLTHRRRISYNR